MIFYHPENEATLTNVYVYMRMHLKLEISFFLKNKETTNLLNLYYKRDSTYVVGSDGNKMDFLSEGNKREIVFSRT